MDNKLTILFCPMNVMGHLNPLIGFGQFLVPKHRVVFAVSQKSKGQLVKYGFEEEPYEVDDPLINMDKGHFKKMTEEKKMFQDVPPMEKMKNMMKDENFFLKMGKVTNPKVKEIAARVKPDLVILDSMFILPGAIKDFPWVSLITSNPNSFLLDNRVPPPFLGLPANDPSPWKQINDELRTLFEPHAKEVNQWYKEEGLPNNPRGDTSMVYDSPYLNFYSFPLELDYTDLRPTPPKWVRVDTFMIKPKEEFQVPEKLKNKPGKLIYFSLGSLSSANVELMKKLINYLSDSPHRFIVSKGMLGDEYELPSNCWGANVVPQTAVLKVVDLVIIHGGNNSLCEAFYYGKPIIVMPVFADQPNNAQRVHEKGFGIRINPFKCTKEELLDAIEKIAKDNELHKKMKLISERCEIESKSNQIVELIEQVVANAKTA